jgi:hypothetical protein
MMMSVVQTFKPQRIKKKLPEKVERAFSSHSLG